MCVCVEESLGGGEGENARDGWGYCVNRWRCGICTVDGEDRVCALCGDNSQNGEKREACLRAALVRARALRGGTIVAVLSVCMCCSAAGVPVAANLPFKAVCNDVLLLRILDVSDRALQPPLHARHIPIMRFLLPIPLPRRRAPPPPTADAAENPIIRPAGLRSLGLCCPLSHLLVVVANTLQLAMMVGFLCLLLSCLAGYASISWFAVFAPLWASDSITLITGAHELSRVIRARPEAFASRRNAIIAQVNRLKGSLGVATFKFLLAMRQDGNWPGLTIVACCSPYFVVAALRLILHIAKKPVTPPDGSSLRPMRPGTPFNPVHPVILMLACRADGLNSVTWTATFWPLWTVRVCGCLGPRG